MHQHLGVGMGAALRFERVGADAFVDVALSKPYLDVPVGPVPADVRAEEEIRKEENAPVVRDRIDHVQHVAAGAGVVQLGFDLGTRIHVPDRHIAGKLRLPPPHIVRRHAGGERAPGIEIG